MPRPGSVQPFAGHYTRTTGDERLAEAHLPTGFIWTRGECGVGTYSASAAGVSVASENSNWVLYDVNKSNA